MKILLFEDDKFTNFYPLSKTRPLHFLRCGAFLLYEKFFNSFTQSDFYFDHRPEFAYLEQNLTAPYIGRIDRNSTGFIAINIRLLCSREIIKIVLSMADNQEACAYGSAEEGLLYGYFADYSGYRQALEDSIFEHVATDELTVLHYPWDLVNNNGSEIGVDFTQLAKRLTSAEHKHFDNVVMVMPENILIGDSVVLKAGVIIDAEDGPVIIEDRVTVMHNSVIVGPCYLGAGSIVKIGAKIYQNCSCGPVCKIGGEIEGSIIHAYSNKQHDGFLGHAYLGEWCNLGADTNNSDLKNNYSPVSVQINGKLVDSGSLFVGLFMGDHSKTGINTMFNTGTVVGVCCNVYGEGFPERNIADFHWGGKGKTIKYPFNRSIEAAAIVKKRRQQELGEAEKSILKQIFDNSN